MYKRSREKPTDRTGYPTVCAVGLSRNDWRPAGGQGLRRVNTTQTAPVPVAPPRRILGVSFLEGVFPLPRSGVGPEVIAGLTLAAIAIPEVMGYTKIAGMPVITGLYTI